MPSKSQAQHNFMEMVAHDPKAAKRVGVSQSVGKDFSEADKGRKFKKGGEMKKMAKGGMAESKAEAREEIARDSVTQAEIDKILEHIDQRFNKLEDKINKLIAR